MQAKKSFGQHFLAVESIASRIASSLLDHYEPQRVLEVGPGTGMLSKYLQGGPHQLKAVEADRDMISYLAKYLPDLEVIPADFMRLDLNELFDGQPFHLIGNYPYNISSQIVFRMIDHRDLIPGMVGMFQKEMAERITSKPGSKEYGVISVLTQVWYQCEYLFTVQEGSFKPPPKVKSAVIRLTRLPISDIGCDYKMFRMVVKQAFSQRRKMLRNTMKALIRDPDILAEPLFILRPEVLTLQQFIDLTNRIIMLNAEEI